MSGRSGLTCRLDFHNPGRPEDISPQTHATSASFPHLVRNTQRRDRASGVNPNFGDAELNEVIHTQGYGGTLA